MDFFFLILLSYLKDGGWSSIKTANLKLLRIYTVRIIDYNHFVDE